MPGDCGELQRRLQETVRGEKVLPTAPGLEELHGLHLPVLCGLPRRAVPDPRMRMSGNPRMSWGVLFEVDLPKKRVNFEFSYYY